MKIKKSLVKVILVWGIFLISSLSFWAVVSFENEELNSFWIVKKLDISFIDTSYAESWEKSSKESWWYKSNTSSTSTNSTTTSNTTNTSNSNCRTVYDTVTTASWHTTKEYRQLCDNPTVSTNVNSNISETQVALEPVKKIELSNLEKQELKTRFENVNKIILKKYSTNTKKLEIFKKLNTLLDEKISTLELIKTNISNELVLEKYEKKILLFKELSSFIQSEILVYIDSVNIEQTAAAEAAKIAAQQAAAAKAAEAAKIAAQQAAAAKAAEAAKIAAQQAAAAKAAEAARIAAQQAAAAKVNTTTKAS